MRRRTIFWFALAASVLVVSSMPAAAASVANINTTEQDFQQATLDNFEIVGTGDAASVEAELGTRESQSFTMVGSGSFSGAEEGLIFELSAEREQIKAQVSNSQVTNVYLRDNADGTLIANVSVNGTGWATINQPLDTTTTYRLTGAIPGGSHEEHDTSLSYPVSTGALTITAGVNGGSESTSRGFMFDEVRVGYPATAEYVGAEHQADADTLFADVDPGAGLLQVEAQANDGTGWNIVDSTSVASAQNVSLDISGTDATRYRTVVSADSGGAVQTVSLDDEGVTFTSSSPTLSNPDPEGETPGYDGDISVDVTDADFALAQGDVITINASTDGSEIGQTQTNTNGTVSIDYNAVGGENNITWTAVDEYGNADSITQNFSTNSELVFVNGTNTSEIVGAPVTVTVQLLGENETVERTSDTGRVSLAGVPVSEPLLATVEPSEGYANRVIYLSSLKEQSTVYLLSTNVSSVDTRFQLQDPTGQFGANSYLFIRKPINESGNITFETVYADKFGVEGVTATLEEDSRYRLRVRSADGVVQDIGPYRADVSETVTVRPGSPSIEIEDYEAGWGAAATLDNQTLEYRYVDPENETDSVTVFIHERGDKSNQLVPNQTYFNLGDAQGAETLTANQSETEWAVVFDVDRGTEQFAVEETTANQPGLVPDLSREWRLIFGVGLLLISAGTFSVLNAGVGGVVVAVEGGLLWWTGWLSGATTGAAVVLALLIAAFAHLYKSRRV